MSNGKQYPVGSPEDLKLTIDILQKFFAEKLKAVELYDAGQRVLGTCPTYSVCHVDGTTDGDG